MLVRLWERNLKLWCPPLQNTDEEKHEMNKECCERMQAAPYQKTVINKDDVCIEKPSAFTCKELSIFFHNRLVPFFLFSRSQNPSKSPL